MRNGGAKTKNQLNIINNECRTNYICKVFWFEFRTNMAVNLAYRVGGVSARVEFNPLVLGDWDTP